MIGACRFRRQQQENEIDRLSVECFELDVKDSPVFVFRNAGNDQVNIVYRRADGNIGWIDPSTAMTA